MNNKWKQPDCVIQAIKNGSLTANNISFEELRKLSVKAVSQFSEDEKEKLWKSLDRGKAILETTAQLDRYSYAHGKMIASQWHHVLDMLTPPQRTAHIIDYGSGQGLSTALLLDHGGRTFIDNIEKITLIEPSKVALTRAVAIVGCYSNKIEIATVNKKFDHLNVDEITGHSNGLTYHIFSNVLDVLGFDHLELLKNTVRTSGTNIILGVSHHRGNCGGSQRLIECNKAIENLGTKNKIVVEHNEIGTFKCNDNKNDAIVFLAELEVTDGLI